MARKTRRKISLVTLRKFHSATVELSASYKALLWRFSRLTQIFEGGLDADPDCQKLLTGTPESCLSFAESVQRFNEHHSPGMLKFISKASYGDEFAAKRGDWWCYHALILVWCRWLSHRFEGDVCPKPRDKSSVAFLKDIDAFVSEHQLPLFPLVDLSLSDEYAAAVGVLRSTDNTWRALKRIAEESVAPLPDTEQMALALLVLHQDWTVTRIAKELHVSRQHLYNLPIFNSALATLRSGRQDCQPGFIDRDGRVDAIAD